MRPTLRDTRVVDFGFLARLHVPLSVPSKDAQPASGSLTLRYRDGSVFGTKQEISDVGLGSTPFFSQLPGGSDYKGPFVLQSRCDGAEGAVRF